MQSEASQNDVHSFQIREMIIEMLKQQEKIVQEQR